MKNAQKTTVPGMSDESFLCVVEGEKQPDVDQGRSALSLCKLGSDRRCLGYDGEAGTDRLQNVQTKQQSRGFRYALLNKVSQHSSFQPIWKISSGKRDSGGWESTEIQT